jgi:glucose uptake protein GlcU
MWHALYWGKWKILRIRFGGHRRAVIGNMLTGMLADTLILAITVFLIWKFETSVTFLDSRKRHD